MAIASAGAGAAEAVGGAASFPAMSGKPRSQRASERGRAAAARAARERELAEEVDVVDAGSREHYADGALYDYEYRRRRADVSFYRELARRRLGGPGRILELGCGSGRVTVPLARDGHAVIGLDQSTAMLRRLQARIGTLPRSVAGRITAVPGDLRAFRVPGEFPLVIAAFNVLEHLYTRVELDACLRCVADHLEPGGVFAFDVQLPDLGWLNRDPNRRWAKTRFTDPTTKRAMFYSTNHDYDPVSQIAVIRLYYDPVDGRTPGRVIKLTQRKYFPAELEALVAHAGFRVIERFGDFSFGPLDGTAESQVLICQVPPKPRRKSGQNTVSSTRNSRFPSRI
ncbi:MAG: methyltransferase domain-containing protein [Deltaproteobacteria bacterium]|nr:methyltransferase domain-containing protein [Deltaproteobacteria bacterium]